MCGIVGIWSENHDIKTLITKMTVSIKHRGPDQQNIYLDLSHNLAVGHSRLSIIDLSDAGSQPMTDSTGRFVIAFNGEIYNFLELKKTISINNRFNEWRGQSDTEVLLQALITWEVKKVLASLKGMFAFALIDTYTGRMILARDKAGEKPLYIGWIEGAFVFSSELKCLENFSKSSLEVNNSALRDLIRFSYIRGEKTIYENFIKLQPGTYLDLSLADLERGTLPEPIKYWDYYSSSRNFHLDNWSTSEIITEADKLLNQAVASQMQADVPLGVFLSSGVDSSLIAAIAQANSEAPIKTFNVGFNDSVYNESLKAARIASFLGTDHYSINLSSSDIISAAQSMCSIYDEPFADASQIPTFLICKYASKSIKVVLTGDGADELFGGYRRHIAFPLLWKFYSRFPKKIRHIIGNMLVELSNVSINYSIPINELLKKYSFRTEIIGRVIKEADDFPLLCEMAMENWGRELPLLDDILFLENRSNNTVEVKNLEHFLFSCDFLNYLCDDILIKLDRAAMNNSIETRCPFLDEGILQLSFVLPDNFKIRNMRGKWILRQILNKYIPDELIINKKMGFTPPIDDWLRHDLRDWAGDLLSSSFLTTTQVFDPLKITDLWNDHLCERRNNGRKLWPIIMYQSWFECRSNSRLYPN